MSEATANEVGPHDGVTGLVEDWAADKQAYVLTKGALAPLPLLFSESYH